MKNKKKNNSMDSLERITRERIAGQLRLARSEKGYSLSDLAGKSGVSTGTIHKIENCSMTPTVVTMIKIVKALRKDLSFFTEDPRGREDYLVVRQKEAKLSFYQPEDSFVRAVSAKLPDARLEVEHTRIQKGGSSGKRLMVHDSEEVTMCLKGRIEFAIHGESMVLEPFDSIHIKGGVPHKYRNVWDQESEAIFIFSPPIFT